MPVSEGKKQHKKNSETQAIKHKGVLTHREFKQKLFQARPDVKPVQRDFGDLQCPANLGNGVCGIVLEGLGNTYLSLC
jgi:hypothetical protein